MNDNKYYAINRASVENSNQLWDTNYVSTARGVQHALDVWKNFYFPGGDFQIENIEHKHSNLKRWCAELVYDHTANGGTQSASLRFMCLLTVVEVDEMPRPIMGDPPQ